MKYSLSKEDIEFRKQIESLEFPVADFDHRAHVRLAYIYLAENDLGDSLRSMRNTIIKLLKHVGVDPSEKYHETLTEAWILAVHHFMKNSSNAVSSNDFIEQNAILLDSKIMLTHYSAEVLFSDEARSAFVEPDIDPIPRYNN